MRKLYNPLELVAFAGLHAGYRFEWPPAGQIFVPVARVAPVVHVLEELRGNDLALLPGRQVLDPFDRC